MAITDEQAHDLACNVAEYVADAAEQTTCSFNATINVHPARHQICDALLMVIEPLADSVTVAELRTALRAGR